MKSNTEDSSSGIILPPGELILKDLTANAIGKIDFLNPFQNHVSKRPMPPLVQNYHDKGQGILHVYAIIFIDYKETPECFNIYQQKSISGSGNSQLHFFITYDKPDTRVQEFTAYRVNFAVNMKDEVDVPSQIEVFLWDEDPRTSRGTVTTVQPA